MMGSRVQRAQLVLTSASPGAQGPGAQGSAAPGGLLWAAGAAGRSAAQLHAVADPALLLLYLRLLLLQSAEYRFLSSLNVLNVVQSGIMFCGISAGVVACTAGVAQVGGGPAACDMSCEL